MNPNDAAKVAEYKAVVAAIAARLLDEAGAGALDLPIDTEILKGRDD